MLYALAILSGILFLIKAGDSIYNYFECKKAEKENDVNVQIGESMIRLVRDGENKEDTAVIIHGWGGAYPVAEFAPLRKLLAKEMNVVTVERPGYGLNSEIYNSRNMENMLEETRSALQCAGIDGKIVLIAHSMGCLEAILWAKKYPDEIKSVVYIDPCTPGFVRDVELDSKRKTGLFLNVIFNVLGWNRIISYVYPKFFKLGRVKAENMNEAVAMLACNGMGAAQVAEFTNLKRNGEKIDEGGYPSELPSYAIVSEKGLAKDYEDYLRDECSMKVVHIGKGHFIHCSDTDDVAQYIINTL